MKKRFTEAQIVGLLRNADAGIPVKDLCRKHVCSEVTLPPFSDGCYLEFGRFASCLTLSGVLTRHEVTECTMRRRSS